MRLNKTDLKKILYDFNSFSNRLIQADFHDYTDALRKYLNFIDSTPIIIDYITDCGTCEMDVGEEVKIVQNSLGRMIFSLGDSEEEEVRNVYAVLKYLVETNNPIYLAIAMGYSSSRKYQDKIKGFNERFVMVLIDHIERYLTKVGIDMGLDDKFEYNVTVQNGQAIIATDNATVTATNNIGIDTGELKNLILAVQETSASLSLEDRKSVSEYVQVIETEVMAERPKKAMIRTALNGLIAVKGITEFGAAVASLIEFISPLL